MSVCLSVCPQFFHFSNFSALGFDRPGVFARTSLWYSPMILDDDDDDDDEEDDDEVEDNDKDDDNNDKDISVLGLDRDMGFSRGHQGLQGHWPYDDDDN